MIILEIEKMTQTGAIEEINSIQGQLVPREKKRLGMRPVCNLKKLNQFIKYEKVGKSQSICGYAKAGRLHDESESQRRIFQ